MGCLAFKTEENGGKRMGKLVNKLRAKIGIRMKAKMVDNNINCEEL